MEYIFNDWHFVKHFKRNGLIYGCLWRGEKPQVWGVENLVQLDDETFALFTRA